jgi:hypothetical protein
VTAGPPGGPSLRALVVADGEVPQRSALDAAWPGWADRVDLVVAADGGVRGARRLGLAIGLWVGDGDSTSAADLARLAADGVVLERATTDGRSTGNRAARAVRRGATATSRCSVLGGSRVDNTWPTWPARPPGAGGTCRAPARRGVSRRAGQRARAGRRALTVALPGRVATGLLLPFGSV